MRISDWSSDVCSSDLHGLRFGPVVLADRVQIRLQVGQQRLEGAAHVRLVVGLVRLEPRALVVARQRAQEPEALVCEVGRHGRQINSPRNYVGAHWGATGACPRIPVAPRSEERTSELQSLMRISYAVFCLQ